jgi:hypothetical protein
MNLRPVPELSRLHLLTRTLPAFVFLALVTAPLASAATDEAAQRQLREDRERFQREIERQRTEAAIQAERARQSADQQRTADELARLRAQQDRQSSELRALSTTTRTLTESPSPIPAPRIATSAVPSASSQLSPAVQPAAAITPDFALTILPDGRCVLHLKDRPPEIKSPAEAQAALQQLLAASKPVSPSP